MPRLDAVIILAGGPGSGCHGPNCGRPRKNPEFGFVSPNMQEHLTFNQAHKNLASDRHRQFHRLAEQMVGDRGRVSDAIGDWSDGAENSMMIHMKGTRNQIRDVAARLGAAADQKAVIAFASGRGKDSVWTVKIPRGDMNALRKKLDSNGIQFRTLEPRSDGAVHVHVFDQGSGLEKNIRQFARQAGGHVFRHTGTGEFIGGDTREEGQRAYREILKAA